VAITFKDDAHTKGSNAIFVFAAKMKIESQRSIMLQSFSNDCALPKMSSYNKYLNMVTLLPKEYCCLA
jgi:hypothetical protein